MLLARAKEGLDLHIPIMDTEWDLDLLPTPPQGFTRPARFTRSRRRWESTGSTPSLNWIYGLRSFCGMCEKEVGKARYQGRAGEGWIQDLLLAFFEVESRIDMVCSLKNPFPKEVFVIEYPLLSSVKAAGEGPVGVRLPNKFIRWVLVRWNLPILRK